MGATQRLVLAATSVTTGAIIIAATSATMTAAQTLAPPPYQTSAEQGAPTAGPQAMDRYGGGARHPIIQPAPDRPQNGGQYGAPTRLLGWAGKAQTQAAAQQIAQPASQARLDMPRQWSAQPQRAARTANPTNASVSQPAAQPSAPTSIYDMPPPSQRPAYQQAADQRPTQQPGGPRFYSVHRDYGIQPDAIPIPPQFFGATADLSAPSTDPLVKRTTTVNGQTRTVAVQPEDQGDQ
jgi:hypothetical protein